MLRGGIRLALVAALLLLDVGCGPTPSAASDSLEAGSEFEVDAKEAPPEKFPLFGPFVKHHGIVLAPRSNQSFWCPWMQQPLLWESKDVFNPAAVVSGTPPTVKMLYRAEDHIGAHRGTSRIGLAESHDGLFFPDELRRKKPVLYPDNSECCMRIHHGVDGCKKTCEEHDPTTEPLIAAHEGEGGCEDPRVVFDGEKSLYLMTYTCFDGRAARLCTASSPTLEADTWEKHGLAFPDLPDVWSKSGSIVARYRPDSPPVAARSAPPRVGPKSLYYMFWGEGLIKIATSHDLRRWKPLKEFSPAERWKGGVLAPRPELFDSELVEPGPPAALIGDYIVLLYNGKNARYDKGGTRELFMGVYSVGQAVMSAADPTKVLHRAGEPLLVPDQPFETEGQFGMERVVFAQGLVHYRGRWLLYYGAGHSFIGVASADETPALADGTAWLR